MMLLRLLCHGRDRLGSPRIESDTQAINHYTSVLFNAASPHWLRDATRGGLATVMNELARDTGLGIVLDDAALEALRAAGCPEAVSIGRIVEEPASSVVLTTGFGGTRMVDMLVGDPLPRIC